MAFEYGSDPYLQEVMETQGWVFEEASVRGFDMEHFITGYMCSSLKNSVDTRQAYYATLDFEDHFKWLDKEGFKPRKGASSDFILCNWLGNFYALIQYRLGIPSRKVIEKLPASDMLMRGRVLHDLDLEIAVDKVIRGLIR